MASRVLDLETSVGPTRVHLSGHGPLVMVLHGGPGFDHRYLRKPLSRLETRRTLAFFDQIGSGNGPASEPGPTTAEAIFTQVRELAGMVSDGNPVGVCAHSWGALVAVGSGVKFAEGLYITPMPLTLETYTTCRERLFSRIPADIAARFASLAATGESDRLVSLMLPYYLGPDSTATVPGLSIRMDTFQGVMDSLGNFDFRGAVGDDIPVDILLAEHDFTTRDLVPELTDAARSVAWMPGVGHFPFAECAQHFDRVLADSFP